VSIAAGVQNLKDVPLFKSWGVQEHLVLYCVLAVALLTFASLRGLKESGTLFAIPTYVFVTMCYVMIALGIIGPWIGWKFHPEAVNQSWGRRRRRKPLDWWCYSGPSPMAVRR